jgi:hypothetical protein
MAINTGKVAVGGVVAGLVMMAVDFAVDKFLLGAQSMAEMNAYKAGSADMMMAGNNKFIYPLLDVVLGIALVWTYAAIRPRFGPGPKTAIYAAIVFWIVSGISYYGYLSMGMMSSGLWLEYSLVGLVNLVIAGCVGAAIYKENATA